MTVREKLLTISPLEMQEKNPACTQQFGVQVAMKKIPPHEK